LTLPKTPAAYPAVQAALDAALARGEEAELTFPSAHQATIWRQKAHKFRQLLRERDGWSSYDHLIFSIPKDRPEVVVIKTDYCPEPVFTGRRLAQATGPEPQAQLSALAQRVVALSESGLNGEQVWNALVPQAVDEELKSAFVEANVKLPDHIEVFS
jgi:hypothetical protein